MKSCDLTTGIGQISHAMADLKQCWLESKSEWSDDVRRQFEEDHLSELPTLLQQTMQAAQRLAEVLHQAERDLEERPQY